MAGVILVHRFAQGKEICPGPAVARNFNAQLGRQRLVQAPDVGLIEVRNANQMPFRRHGRKDVRAPGQRIGNFRNLLQIDRRARAVHIDAGNKRRVFLNGGDIAALRPGHNVRGDNAHIVFQAFSQLYIGIALVKARKRRRFIAGGLLQIDKRVQQRQFVGLFARLHGQLHGVQRRAVGRQGVQRIGAAPQAHAALGHADFRLLHLPRAGVDIQQAGRLPGIAQGVQVHLALRHLPHLNICKPLHRDAGIRQGAYALRAALHHRQPAGLPAVGTEVLSVGGNGGDFFIFPALCRQLFRIIGAADAPAHRRIHTAIVAQQIQGTGGFQLAHGKTCLQHAAVRACFGGRAGIYQLLSAVVCQAVQRLIVRRQTRRALDDGHIGSNHFAVIIADLSRLRYRPEQLIADCIAQPLGPADNGLCSCLRRAPGQSKAKQQDERADAFLSHTHRSQGLLCFSRLNSYVFFITSCFSESAGLRGAVGRVSIVVREDFSHLATGYHRFIHIATCVCMQKMRMSQTPSSQAVKKFLTACR